MNSGKLMDSVLKLMDYALKLRVCLSICRYKIGSTTLITDGNQAAGGAQGVVGQEVWLVLRQLRATIKAHTGLDMLMLLKMCPGPGPGVCETIRSGALSERIMDSPTE